jgi:hypothetical protein
LTGTNTFIAEILQTPPRSGFPWADVLSGQSCDVNAEDRAQPVQTSIARIAEAQAQANAGQIHPVAVHERPDRPRRLCTARARAIVAPTFTRMIKLIFLRG